MPRGDRPAEPLTPGEVRALLAACAGDTLTGIRNRALLVVLWRAGLRIGEALRLKPSDVDFVAGTIRVLHSKSRQARTVGIDGQALDVLRAWLGARQAAGLDPAGLLFCRLRGQPGAPLSARYVGAQMVRLAEMAGVAHRVHPHGLRHTMAVESVREGVPVPKISRQLGHATVATTQTYIDHLYPAEVIDVYRARSWG
jgi:integrase/recombinase XerD